jgi:EAL domain-containing protein (putative c-di-GMP-specific phosphodiesterase class I)
VRTQDTVARLSGDELVVLIPGSPAAEPASTVADRLLRALHVPPLRSGHETVTASIGLAVSQPGDVAEGLLSDADAAMYRAKRHGGARWVLFGSEMREERQNRSVSEAQLRDALANDGLRVLYQPIVSLDDGHTIGAEALVRLRNADGRLLVPDDFIQTAEETGLVLPLGQRVLDHACRQPVRWVNATALEPFVAVNVSPRQLEESHMVTAVASALTASGLSGDRLRLEVTESALLDIGPAVRGTLNELRSMGVQIGVDDFGTGYASMAYVRNLPLDFVKIDKSYVAGMETDARDRAMVEATLTLSHSLGLRSVAEGIETQAHWDILRDLGCSEGQGFLFARPVRSSLVSSSGFCPAPAPPVAGP